MGSNLRKSLLYCDLRRLSDSFSPNQEGGTTAEPVLRHVEVAIVDQATCRSNYFLVNTVTDRMICAAVSGGGKDACQVRFGLNEFLSLLFIKLFVVG